MLKEQSIEASLNAFLPESEYFSFVGEVKDNNHIFIH